jgi:N-acyl-D-aspartate/D-glutamate deacylase
VDDTADRQFRASDADRKIVADRLRQALDEGRLTLSEYDERVGVAYAATTYADLNTLLRDLPTQGGVLEIRPMASTPTPVVAEVADAPPRPKKRRRMPLALSILWTVWGGVVGLNLVVWMAVAITTPGSHYFWPIWVALPTGALLTAATIGVQAIRRGRG